MKLNRVLIITKPYASGGARRTRSRLLGRAHRRLQDDMERAIEGMGLDLAVASRPKMPRTKGFDLIVTFGGDGTFLAAAHIADGTPILGVNASPDHSVGFFCMAQPHTFARVLRRIAEGKLSPRELPLIETRIGPKRLGCLALNDVLFAGTSPAETVRYEISAGGRREEQKSSGVWISSGPGSTAAIESAGGRPLGIFSRRLQFLVREPCVTPGSRYRMTRGVLRAGAPISLASHMRTGRVYIDGHWHEYEVPEGARLTCRVSKKTLKVFI
jgi:NAD+ kinase